MEQNIISLGFNVAEFTAEQKIVYEASLKTYQLLKEMDGFKIGVGGSGEGWSVLKTQVTALEVQLKKLQETNAKLTQSILEGKKAAQEEAAATKTATAATKEKEKADRDATRSLKEKTAAQERDKKIAQQAADEYQNLNKALVDAEKRYKNLALTQGFNNEQTKIALKEALALRGVLNKVDSELGNYQRNVGNYKSGFNGLSQSFSQIVREAPSAAISLNTFFLGISNNLPMFFDEVAKIKKIQAEALVIAKESAALARVEAEARAIQTGATKEAAIAEGLLAEKTAMANAQTVKAPSLWKQLGSAVFSFNTLLTVAVLALTLFGSKIVNWISSLGGAKDAIFDLAEQQKLLAKLNEEAAKSAGKEQASLVSLKAAIESTKVPMATRLQAVKDLKKEFPGLFDGLTTEQLLTGNVANAYDLATEAILKKARASAASAELEIIASKKFEILRKAEQDRLETEEKIRNAKAFKQTVSGSGGSMSMGTSSTEISATKEVVQKQIRDKYNLRAKGYQDEIDQENQKQTFLLQFIVDGAKETIKVEEAKSKSQKDVTDKTAEDILKTNFEMGKRHIQIQIDANKAIVDNERTHYFDQLKALEAYNKAKIEMIELQRDFEIDSEKLKYDETIAGLKKQANDKDATPEFKAKIDAQIAREKEAHLLRLVNIESKYYDDIRRQGQSYLADIKKIEKERLDSKKDFLDQERDYEEWTLAQIKKAREAQAAGMKKLDKQDEDRAKAKAELIFNFTKDFTNKAIDLVQTLVDAGYTRQQNAIQALIDANNEYESAETQRIENSTLNEQEKADKLIVLNASVAAKNKQLAQEQKELDIKKAQFDKQAGIAKIILNTAIGVSNALTTGDPYTAGLRAAIVAALGAAELAIAIATPIPTYAEGTDNHPGGYAITGEGKHAELVSEPGKRPYVVDKATLSNLPAGTKVKPLTGDYINEQMYASMITSQAERLAIAEAVENKRSNTAWKIARWQTEELKEHLGGKNKPIHNYIKMDLGFASYIQKQIFGR